jgi:hypothetical protein
MGRLLAVLVALISALAAGYFWGGHATRNAIEADTLRRERQAVADTRNAEYRADAIAADYLTKHLAQEQRYAALSETNRQLARRVGLLAAGPVLACHVDPAGAAVAATEPDRPAPATGTERQAPVAHAGPADPDLSLRAVWVWNSALNGVDQPSGACDPVGAAAGAGAACAQSSGISLEEAWANHALNAKSCREDRARYSSLIRVLRERGIQAEPTH